MSSAVTRDVIFCEIPGFRPLTLDLHRPEAPSGSGSPVVVFIHGGGWRLGSRRSFGPNFTVDTSFARLVAAGFAVVSIDYRLSSEAHFPAQLDDVREALAWVRDNAGEHSLDSTRIVIWGESAGATLGSLAALEPQSSSGPAIAGVIDWYGPTDLVAMAAAEEAGELAATRESMWLGGTAVDLPDAARAASPLYQVRPGAPSFFIAHGTDDRFVPVAQSERFADALAAAGGSVEFTAVPGANHMWNGVADPTPLFDSALDFAVRVTGAPRD